MTATVVTGLAGPGRVALGQGYPLRIDCPDAPLYAVGGLTLSRDMQAKGLVLAARLTHNRTAEVYDISCATEAASQAGAQSGAQSSAQASAEDGDQAEAGLERKADIAAGAAYQFVCTARADGHLSGGAQARRDGRVPAGLGLDHPETRAAIAAAVCPAARLALSRFRAGLAD